MFRSRFILTFFLLFVLAISCGDSQAVIDARVANEVNLALQREKDKEAAELQRQKEAAIRREDYAYVKSVLDDYNNQLVICQDRLEDAKRPKFLRTRAEKENELTIQLNNLRNVEESIVYLTELLDLISKGSPYTISEKLQSRRAIANSK
jgi:hypothetical protein